MVCSPDGDTDYFDIVTEVLQGDILALFLFIISYLPTPPLGQDMTQGQFLSEV